MTKISQRLLMSALFFVFLPCMAFSAGSQKFSQYCNERYGFCVGYPTGLIMDEPPVNGDGRKFHDAQGFVLIASGINNVLDDTFASTMQSQLQEFDNVTYKATGKNWFVLSGTKGSDILYLKTFVGKGSKNDLYIEYPASQKAAYDTIVGEISRSFKPGDLNEYH